MINIRRSLSIKLSIGILLMTVPVFVLSVGYSTASRAILSSWRRWNMPTVRWTTECNESGTT